MKINEGDSTNQIIFMKYMEENTIDWDETLGKKVEKKKTVMMEEVREEHIYESPKNIERTRMKNKPCGLLLQ